MKATRPPRRPSPAGSAGNRSPGRRGTILVFGLMCLALVTASLLSATQLTLGAARFRRTAETAATADWLAEAGLTLAAQRLRQNPQYTGETLELAPADSGLAEPARLTIRIEQPAAAEPDDAQPDDQQPDATRAVVEARYPADSATPVTAVVTGRLHALPAAAEQNP